MIKKAFPDQKYQSMNFKYSGNFKFNCALSPVYITCTFKKSIIK